MTTTDREKTGKRSAIAVHDLPATWQEIKAGDLVIAQESLADGWWEALVVAINGDDLTIRWRDYPKLRQLHRNRFSVALLHPKI